MMAPAPGSGAALLVKGQRVGADNRWLVMRKLGEGQFAEVWEVRDTAATDDRRLAIKVEKRTQARTVRQEYKVLRRVAELCPQVCPVLHAGSLQPEEDRFFMVMQLLGSNLADVRRSYPGGRMDAGTVRVLAGQLLDAVQAVHSTGYIHRDVKPANFAMVPGTPGVGEWRLLDFGLARRYLDDAGALLPARADAAFRGSTTYASLNAHAGEDLSRRDDLWSWLYCVVELAEGTLPWRHDLREGQADGAGGGAAPPLPSQDSYRGTVAAMKAACAADPHKLSRATPAGAVMAPISAHLGSLGFLEEPDYGLIRALLARVPDAWEQQHPGAPQPPPQPASAADLLSGEQLQAVLLAAEGGGGGAGGGGGSAGGAEAAAVRNMCEGVEWVRQGGAGPGVAQLVQAVGALHPADSLAVVASVVGNAVATTPPAACNALAALMHDLSLFAQAAAKRAGARHAAWQYAAAAAAAEQDAQQQQQPGVGATPNAP